MKSSLPCLLAAIILLSANPARAVPQSGSFESFHRQARSGARLNVVFFGGPFTEGAGVEDVHQDSWRERFQQFLGETYPRAVFHFELVSMGDAGSKRAMFHSQEVISEKKPDLAFIDFLIEDGIHGENRDALAAYESVLNDFAHAGVPIMQVFTGIRSIEGTHWKPVMPQRLRDYLEFVTLYRTGVGESYQSLHQILASNQFTMDNIWPNNARYPTAVGHDLIFVSLREGYLNAVTEKRHGMHPSTPAFAWLYQSRREVALTDLPMPEGWATSPPSSPQGTISSKGSDGDMAVWESSNDKTARPIRLDFNGTMVAVSGESDTNSLEFKVTIDGKPISPPAGPGKKKQVEWTLSTPGSDSGMTQFWVELTSKLAPGPHSLELTPLTEDSGRIGQLRIRSFFIAGE